MCHLMHKLLFIAVVVICGIFQRIFKALYHYGIKGQVIVKG